MNAFVNFIIRFIYLPEEYVDSSGRTTALSSLTIGMLLLILFIVFKIEFLIAVGILFVVFCFLIIMSFADSAFLADFSDSFFAFIDKYVVFANDMNVIRTCIQKFNSKKTLAYSKSYKYKTDSLCSKAIYFNPQYFSSAINSIFKENQFPMKMGSVFTQYNVQDNEIIAEGSIGFEIEIKNKTQNLWDVVLDTASYFKPQIVINADNFFRSIFYYCNSC